MFYMSSWGTVRLVFKFPKELLELEKIKQYYVEDQVSIIETSKYYLLDIATPDEEDISWIQGEGCLSSLISLREDILNGDYRLLYLIWLKNSIEAIDSGWDSVNEHDLEPQVPKQLNELNGPLQDFIEIFDVSIDYIHVAAENSLVEVNVKAIDYETYIDKLTENEKHEFLVRLLNEEALLSVKFKTRLKKFSDLDNVVVQEKARRSVGELARRVDELRQERKNKEHKKSEEIRLNKIKDIELQEDRHWVKVYQLISDKNTKAYDEAIILLKDLKELSIHTNSFNDYCDKINLIKQDNRRLSGLVNRI